jgi:hypothetical protein
MTRQGGFDLLSAAKSNPEGLLLLAAGFALLMRSGSSSAARTYGSGAGGQQFQPDQGRSGGWRVPDGVGQATQSARDYATGMGERMAEVGEQVKETAGSYAASAASFASETGRNVSDHSMRLAQQAQSTVQGTMNRVLQEQPLAVALAGLAAGAAVAAMFPATEIEQRTLGPAGERVAELAERTGEQLKEATAKAGERLMSAAEERGLNADGLKEVAKEVAGAFGSTFSGEQSKEGTSSGSQPSGSSGSSAAFGGSPGSGSGQSAGRTLQSGGGFSDTQGKSALNPDAARSPQPGKSNQNIKS